MSAQKQARNIPSGQFQFGRYGASRPPSAASAKNSINRGDGLPTTRMIGPDMEKKTLSGLPSQWQGIRRGAIPTAIGQRHGEYNITGEMHVHEGLSAKIHYDPQIDVQHSNEDEGITLHHGQVKNKLYKLLIVKKANSTGRGRGSKAENKPV